MLLGRNSQLGTQSDPNYIKYMSSGKILKGNNKRLMEIIFWNVRNFVFLFILFQFF